MDRASELRFLMASFIDTKYFGSQAHMKLADGVMGGWPSKYVVLVWVHSCIQVDELTLVLVDACVCLHLVVSRCLGSHIGVGRVEMVGHYEYVSP